MSYQCSKAAAAAAATAAAAAAAEKCQLSLTEALSTGVTLMLQV
jgi:hypothetical protein